MSVMFDPEAAIYPFPPKPVPLSMDEKQFYREKIKRLLKERDAVMVAHYTPIRKSSSWRKRPEAVFLTLWRWRALVQNILLPRSVAGCDLWGNGKILSPENHPDANAERGVFTGSRLSD